MRVLAVVILLGLFYGVLWLHWDGQQLLLFDLPARRFHIFGLTLFPQDFFYLSAIMIIGALTLFFFTALAGRLWCGYACPQTVWTEVFLWIERKVEGDRRNQMKLDKSPWTVRKLAIKTTKHGIWIALSLWTGFTFVGYFTPVLELGARFMTWDLGPWEFFWIFFYGFATYGNAGWMREQVCIYMCPYARFQSAMFDNNTLVISYDSARGESRGARKRSTDHRAAGLGDCIDCTMCVQVCPTGIDIRDGLQYQCIACAACVDACDRVMDKMGYEKGLIRYTTENALSGEKARILRPLVVIYGIALLALVVALAVGIASRTPLVLDVIRDRNTLYRETGEGLVENVYTLKLINMDDTDHRYAITVSGIEGMELDLDRDQIPVAAHEVLSVSARVRADPYSLERASSTIVFTLQSVDDVALKVEEEARFLGPVAQAQ
ncbi:MAG: cytochrome c oxidase accessory protein CcoG [Gammaproteobacteria bacterium]|nr:cytochrome c oxidase accessory protein CcoG [Gammaproteobacteria bacterium]NCF80616.1 cytochrome c oxidase accessory protein CcoG [Pseudomonadota bacterium]